MPSVSQKQKGFMGAVLGRQQAGESLPSDPQMSESQLKDFTAGPAQGLPEKAPKHKHHKKHTPPGFMKGGAGRQPKPRGG